MRPPLVLRPPVPKLCPRPRRITRRLAVQTLEDRTVPSQLVVVGGDGSAIAGSRVDFDTPVYNRHEVGGVETSIVNGERLQAYFGDGPDYFAGGQLLLEIADTPRGQAIGVEAVVSKPVFFYPWQFAGYPQLGYFSERVSAFVESECPAPSIGFFPKAMNRLAIRSLCTLMSSVWRFPDSLG